MDVLFAADTLNIVLSYQCNVRCDHCCVSSGPHIEDVQPWLESVGMLPDQSATIPRLDDVEVIKLIEDAALTGTIKTIVFTGGEPTLFRRMLEAGISKASSLGLTTRIVSNASWALTEQAAKRMIGHLTRAGLDQICFSCSDYHEAYIDFNCLKRAYSASLQSQLEIAFSIIIRNRGKVSKTFLCELLEVDTNLIGQRIHFFTSHVMPSGRAQNLPAEDFMTSTTDESAYGPCAGVMRSPAVAPDGKLFACCGYPYRELPELDIGSIRQTSLDQLLNKCGQDVLLAWIHSKGPYAIMKQLDPELEPKFGNICEACQLLLGTIHYQNLLESYFSSRGAEDIYFDQVLSGPAINLTKSAK